MINGGRELWPHQLVSRCFMRCMPDQNEGDWIHFGRLFDSLQWRTLQSWAVEEVGMAVEMNVNVRRSRKSDEVLEMANRMRGMLPDGISMVFSHLSLTPGAACLPGFEMSCEGEGRLVSHLWRPRSLNGRGRSTWTTSAPRLAIGESCTLSTPCELLDSHSLR